MKPSLAVFLHSHRYDRLYQAVSLVLTASSMGWPCQLFLFYGALGSYVSGAWDEINIVAEGSGDAPEWMRDLAHGFEAANVPSLYEMLETAAKEPGGVKVLACSMSCRVLGLDVRSVREKVDEVVGLPTMVQLAECAAHVVHI